MKIIYTILFFIDTFLLVVLSFQFLKLSDAGMSGMIMALIIFGILTSITLLVYFLYRYFKLPPTKGNHKF